MSSASKSFIEEGGAASLGSLSPAAALAVTCGPMQCSVTAAQDAAGGNAHVAAQPLHSGPGIAAARSAVACRKHVRVFDAVVTGTAAAGALGLCVQQRLQTGGNLQPNT